MADQPDYENGEPEPMQNGGPSMHDLVCHDFQTDHFFKMSGPMIQAEATRLMQERKEYGEKKYGTILQANNGRIAENDAQEEALDLLVYAKQMTEEEPEDSPMYLNVKAFYSQVLKTFLFSLRLKELKRARAST